MTEKLYYEDSHLRDFTAKVIKVSSDNGKYQVVLDRTAFFPTGGGQACDGGSIAGSEVLDVFGQGDEIIHVVAAPLVVGDALECSINWDTRFRRMQNHSGEHIISGLIHKRFGFNNVGFHMGEGGMIIDFNGEMTDGDILEVELAANKTVYENLPVTAEIHPDGAPGIEYRSKLDFSGDVRLVSIAGIDLCACCAPHVRSTGEIGVIKILDWQRHRGGMRLTAVCGMDAFLDYRQKFNSVVEISRALSAKQGAVSESVSRVLGELEGTKAELIRTRKEMLACKIERLRETEGNICVFEENMDQVSLRELVNAGMELASGVCAAFCGRDGEYNYIIGSKTVDLRSASREINAAIDGRGGGSASMIQGSSRACAAVIKDFIENTKF